MLVGAASGRELYAGNETAFAATGRSNGVGYV
ncbi:MAG: hypothetical protein H6R19_27 [Proteobacteria bacterium]|nr:hypothetical protein [Pseudomonadota bacterium]